MITYEDIVKANKSIKTTDIKGKDYAEVNQRIKAFRMVFPEGSITTQLLKDESGVCVFAASVGRFDENGIFQILGTGTAYEKEGSNFINSTSYIENCETSAVGRALGMAGFGIDTSVASAEEVANAIANQKPEQKEYQKKPEKKPDTKMSARDQVIMRAKKLGLNVMNLAAQAGWESGPLTDDIIGKMHGLMNRLEASNAEKC